MRLGVRALGRGDSRDLGVGHRAMNGDRLVGHEISPPRPWRACPVAWGPRGAWRILGQPAGASMAFSGVLG